MNLQINDVTIVLISLSTLLLSGFLVTRITKLLRLPNVSGFILAGILMGPYALNVIPANIIDNMGFVGDIALAFIAFDVGKFLKKEIFAKNGKTSIIITLCESLLAGILITFSMHFIFKLGWNFSLLLGAIATATAPASTMMTINQYKAKGAFVDTLLQVITLDDIVCLVIFSIIAASISATESGHFSLLHTILPILYNIGAVLIGCLLAVLLNKLFTPHRSKDNKLILTTAFLLGLSGLCSIFHISPLLACMAFGAVYVNKTNDIDLYNQINNFTPPIFSLFFIISGINLDIGTLSTLGIIGVAYFIIRIFGKYVGAYFGAIITGSNEDIRNYLGFALIPQAGVSIGLAFLGKRILPPDMGNQLMTIILASSVLYELVGPVSAKMALINSGAINKEKLEFPSKKELKPNSQTQSKSKYKSIKLQENI